MRLKNKIALITGSSRGIGKATALLLAKEGAKVAVNYFSSEKEAFAVVDEIKKIGSEAIAIKCDVSKENEVIEMINQATETFGKIDILVNNAGIVYDVPLFERSVEQRRKFDFLLFIEGDNMMFSLLRYEKDLNYKRNFYNIIEKIQ